MNIKHPGSLGNAPAVPVRTWAKKIRAKSLALLHRVCCLETIRFFAKENSRASDVSPSKENPGFGSIEFLVPDATQLARHGRDLARHFHLSAELMQQRLAQGSRALLAVQDGRVAAMLWMSFESLPVSEAGMCLQLHSNEFITYNAMTRPQWRAHGLSTALNLLAYDFARLHGRTVQLTWRSVSNRSALRVAQRLGQQTVGELNCLRLFGQPVWSRYVSAPQTSVVLDERLVRMAPAGRG